MKRVIYLLNVLTLAVVAASCNSQQNQPDDPKDDEPSIVGEWKCTSITESMNQEGGPSSVSYKVDWDWYLNFEENGQYGENRGEGYGLERGQWYIIGNKLFLDDNEYIIVQLAKKSLVLKEVISGTDWVEYTYTRIK